VVCLISGVLRFGVTLRNETDSFITEGCDPERAWLLKVFLAVMEGSEDPIVLKERRSHDE